MSVRGAVFLGRRLDGRRGHLRAPRRSRRRGGRRRVGLVPARRDRGRTARLHLRQARRPLPVEGRPHRLPRRGLRQRTAASASRPGWATSRRSSSSAPWSPSRSAATRRRCSSATTRAPRGTTSSPPSSSSAPSASTSSARGSSIVRRQRSSSCSSACSRSSSWRRSADVDWDLLAFSGYPSFSDIVASVALTFFAFLGLQRHHLRRRRSRGPCARASAGDVHRARHHGQPVHADLARRLRDAPGRRGRRLRRDRHRRGGAADARRRRVHDDGHRRAAGDDVIDQRDALRLRRPHHDARRDGKFPPVFGCGRASAATPGSSSPRRSCSSLPTSSTCRRSRRSAAPSRSRCSCSSASRATGGVRTPEPTRAHARRDRRLGDRARLLRRRHAPQRSVDLRRDRGDRAARGRPRHRLAAARADGRRSGRRSGLRGRATRRADRTASRAG